jgi:O-antigen/teichoic acid export membrane protein
MRTFALAQSLRVLAIFAVVVAVGSSPLPDWVLVAGFTVAELLLFPLLLLAVLPLLRVPAAESTRGWMRRHGSFGTRALPSGLLAESFVRVDVIMLGLFVNDARVGVYSFAAMFIEGLYQLAVVFRTVANPILVTLLAGADTARLGRFCRRAGLGSFAAVAATAVVVWAAFPLLLRWYPQALIQQARGVLAILAVGLCAYAPFVPSDQILLQAGLPGRQSALMTANLGANVLANAVLIPRYGIHGAALATALAYGLSAVTLSSAIARWLGLRGSLLLRRGPAVDEESR